MYLSVEVSRIRVREERGCLLLGRAHGCRLTREWFCGVNLEEETNKSTLCVPRFRVNDVAYKHARQG
jgi:hypothetical protein